MELSKERVKYLAALLLLLLILLKGFKLFVSVLLFLSGLFIIYTFCKHQYMVDYMTLKFALFLAFLLMLLAILVAWVL